MKGLNKKDDIDRIFGAVLEFLRYDPRLEPHEDPFAAAQVQFANLLKACSEHKEVAQYFQNQWGDKIGEFLLGKKGAWFTSLMRKRKLGKSTVL